jgi:hypothetical protein
MVGKEVKKVSERGNVDLEVRKGRVIAGGGGKMGSGEGDKKIMLFEGDKTVKWGVVRIGVWEQLREKKLSQWKR